MIYANGYSSMSPEELFKQLDKAVSRKGCKSAPEKRSSSQPDNDDALLLAMQSMESTLSSSSLEQQVDILFAALKRAVDRDEKPVRTEVNRLLSMWQPVMGAAASTLQSIAAESSAGDCMELFQRCTAGVADAPRIIRSVADQCEFSRATGCMPLYVVRSASVRVANVYCTQACHSQINYIFDGDELSAYDMKHGKDETAMYSSNSPKKELFTSSQLRQVQPSCAWSGIRRPRPRCLSLRS